MFCEINGDTKSLEVHLNTSIELRMTKHPSRKVMNFRHLLGCDTIPVVKILTNSIGVTGKICEKARVRLLRDVNEKSANFGTLATSNIRVLLFW